MKRFFAPALILILALPSLSQAASPFASFLTPASPSPVAAPPAAPVAPPAAAPASPTQIANAIAALQNPTQRDALIATLQAMQHEPANAPSADSAGQTIPADKASLASTAPATTPTTAAPAAIPVAAGNTLDQTLGAHVLTTVANSIERVSTEFGTALHEATNIKLVWHWILFVAGDAWLRAQFINASWQLMLVMGTALAAEYLAIRALARPRAFLVHRASLIRRPLDPALEHKPNPIEEAEAGQTERLPRRRTSLRTLIRRLPYMLGHLLLSLLPIILVAVVGTLWLSGFIGSQRVERLVIVATLNAYLVCRVVLEAMRFLVAPSAPALRLISTSDRRAKWLVNWLRRLIAVAAFGYAAISTGEIFGLYPAASNVLLKLVSFVLHFMAAIMVIQARRPVARWIRGNREATGLWALLRRRLANSWHVIALFYIVALWFAWAVGIPHAFFIMLRIVVVFVIVTAAARALSFSASHGLDVMLADESGVSRQFPTMHKRVRSYALFLRAVIDVTVGSVALLVILQGWGVNIFTWLFVDRLGGRIASAVITIGLTIAVALVAWEICNAGLQMEVDRLARSGRAGRAARLKTLLPMLRTTLFVFIGIVVALVVLSSIGVNIAPLLAGAGVIGLAIGFGSQKLVQDIITGLFLLLEDAMQVGDVVSLGGLTGTVEKLSIRTIKLRAGDGSINIIPFSAVTTVTNMTREFGMAQINIGVGYREDIDRVQGILREIGAEMRAEPKWGAMMRDDVQIFGLDQFGASSVVITGQIRTGPGQHWAVRREYNRRVKIRFDAENIEMPYNYQRITIDPQEFRDAFARPQAAGPAVPPAQT